MAGGERVEVTIQVANTYTVPLKKLIDELKLEEVYMPADPAKLLVSSADINRPGLQFTGYFEFFDNHRIQILGLTELGYLETKDIKTQIKNLERLFSQRPPCCIFTRSLEIPEEIKGFAEKYQVPLLRTEATTSTFMAGLIATLNVELAPRVSRHGVLVEVYGEGVLLLGESGVGKSETAIELIKRGHRVIADDLVEIKRVSNTTLVGSAPDNIRHFMELRGVGIINARKLFGIGSVKMTEKIDMTIQLEAWQDGKPYDRLGLEEEYMDILGIKVPSLTIPVTPGRNLAVIVEVAAMNSRQKKMGYNAAEELLNQLGMSGDLAEEVL